MTVTISTYAARYALQVIASGNPLRKLSVVRVHPGGTPVSSTKTLRMTSGTSNTRGIVRIGLTKTLVGIGAAVAARGPTGSGSDKIRCADTTGGTRVSQAGDSSGATDAGDIRYGIWRCAKHWSVTAVGHTITWLGSNKLSNVRATGFGPTPGVWD
jgi:hypothetical protein